MRGFIESPLVRYFGVFLSLIATGYVAWVFIQLKPWSLDVDWGSIAPILVIASVIYGMLGVLVGLAWHQLVEMLEPGVLSPRDCVIIYAKSQIAKYLPTNTLHFVGRYAMARSKGANGKMLIASTGIEQLVTVCLAGAIGVPVLSNIASSLLPEIVERASWALYGIIAIGILVACIFFRRQIFGVLAQVSLLPIFLAAFFLVTFYLIAGGLFQMTTAEIVTQGSAVPSYGRIVSAIALAWAVGMAAPGAGAGIGIREAVLIHAFEGLMSPEMIILAAVLFRMVTVVGDILLFIFGASFFRRN